MTKDYEGFTSGGISSFSSFCDLKRKYMTDAKQEALRQALCYYSQHSVKKIPSADAVVKTAKKFENFLVTKGKKK